MDKLSFFKAIGMWMLYVTDAACVRSPGGGGAEVAEMLNRRFLEQLLVKAHVAAAVQLLEEVVV